MTVRIPFSLVIVATLLAPAPSHAQIWKKVKETVKKAAEDETLSQIDQLVRGKVRCVFDDPVCLEQAQADGKEVVLTDDSGTLLTDEDGAPITDPGAAPAATAPKPGEGAWANYDFIPGERVLFADDWSADQVGDFPRRVELVRGNWDIVEWQGRRLLRHTGPRHGAVAIHLPEALPERFTIETEVYFPEVNQQLAVTTERAERNVGELAGNWFQIARNGTGVKKGQGASVEALNRVTGTVDEALTAIRIMADGRYVKVYVNERRVANVPNAELARTEWIYLENTYSADEEHPMLIGPIRVAAGGRDLYDALAENGRVATRGIYFGTNSARIRPESTPTLEQIGTMLRDHPELRLTIEGHTDSDGDEAYNQQLSGERAGSVRDYLVESYGIDASRLETAGFGEARPVAGNDTPEGKQQNRRVELVRIGG